MKEFLRKLIIFVFVVCSLLLAQLIFVLPVDSFSSRMDIFVFNHQETIAGILMLSCLFWVFIKLHDFLKSFLEPLQKEIDDWNRNR